MNSIFSFLPSGGLPFSLLDAKKVEDFTIEGDNFSLTVDTFGTYFFISNAFMCGLYPSATDTAYSETIVYVVSDAKPMYALYMYYFRGELSNSSIEVKTPEDAGMQIDGNNVFTAPVMSVYPSGSYEDGGSVNSVFKIE